MFLDTEDWITTVCLTYLSFTKFNTDFCSSDKEFEGRLQEAPLYDYAARYWGYHVLTSSTNHTMALDLLEKDENISACAQALMV